MWLRYHAALRQRCANFSADKQLNAGPRSPGGHLHRSYCRADIGGGCARQPAVKPTFCFAWCYVALHLVPLFLSLEVGVINSISILSPSFSLPISIFPSPHCSPSGPSVCALRSRASSTPPNPPVASSVCVCRCETQGQIISALTSPLIPSLSAHSPLLYLFSFSRPFIYLAIPPSLPHRFEYAWSSQH